MNSGNLRTVVLLVFISGISSLNILVSHPIYAGSHVLTLHTLSQPLLEKGHRITTIRFKDDDLPPLHYGPNHTLIVKTLNNSFGDLPFMTHSDEAQFKLPLQLIWGLGSDIFWTVGQMIGGDKILIPKYCETILDEELVTELEEDHYDFAIIDLMFNECGLALAHRLNLPVVGYWAFSFASGVQEFTVQENPPSFVPAMMSHMSGRMSFIERVWNMVTKLVSKAFMLYHASIVDQVIGEKLPKSPKTAELLSNLSGVMINTDFVLDYPRAQPPNFINVGGLQIKADPGAIPADMLSFINGAPEGILLFTMGFIFNAKAVPHAAIAGLMAVFRRLPQRVVIKLDSEYWREAAPANVMVVPWVPQQAVLAHNNTRLFITHCGMHGVLESIFYGVPMVGMPVFIDQGDVLRRMTDAGIGVGVSKSASGEELYRAIIEVRDNPVYKDNIDKLSRVFRDKRTHPQDVAVDFLEFVGRTKGAQHLKVRSGHLNLAQYHSLDVITFLLICLMAGAWILLCGLRSCVASAGHKTKKD